MLQKAAKVSFIFLAMAGEVDSIALNFALGPLSHVDIALRWLPNSSAMFLIMEPLSWVILSIFPEELPYFWSLVVDKPTFIGAFGSDLYTLGFLSMNPLSLEDPVVGNHDSCPVNISLFNITEV